MSHLQEHALTTPDKVSSELGIPTHQDGSEFLRISTYIMVASDMFTKHVGFDVHYVEEKTSKVGQPRGRNKLIVDEHLPLKQIHEIQYKDNDPVDAGKYEISDAELGYIRHTSKRSWRDTQIYQSQIRSYSHETEPLYSVTYDAGWVTPHQANEDDTLERDLPHDIEMAVMDLAVMLYNEAGQDSRIKSASTGDWSFSLSDEEVPNLFRMVADNYRLITV